MNRCSFAPAARSSARPTGTADAHRSEPAVRAGTRPTSASTTAAQHENPRNMRHYRKRKTSRAGAPFMQSRSDLDSGRRHRAAQPYRPARWYGSNEGVGEQEYRIGVLIPMSGAAGIWGPSCLACATLAAEEWNAAGGVDGKSVALTVLEASDECDALEEQLQAVLDADAIESIVGMHTSSVRERVTAQLRGALPFVYTPLYEGGP